MNTKATGFRRFGTLLAAAGLLAVVIAIVTHDDEFHDIADAWDALEWQYLILLIPLAILNHAIRYFRWEVLLKWVSSIVFRRTTAIFVFSAGSLLIFTPGRIGEIAKIIYARDLFGIPVATSLPILIAERITDVVVMALLASIGFLMLGEAPDFIVAGIMLTGILLIAILRAPILGYISRKGLPGFLTRRGFDQMLNQASVSQTSLFTRRALTPNFALGSCAWMVEVTIFFLSLCATGIDVDSQLFVLALAIFPLASLGGSLSFLPGGLGITEGLIVALSVPLSDISEGTVLLAAILTRIAIMGTVIVIGLVSLPLLHGRSSK